MVGYWKHLKPIDEDLTTIAGWTPDALAARRADIRARADERCAAEYHAVIREGVETSAGLVIEARASVALVQPRVGTATWKPIAELRPIAPTRPCELTASELAARDLGER